MNDVHSSVGSVARIVHTHTPALFDAAVAETIALLRQGQVVALPTETVYGLAGNALNAAAVARIFEIKGRPAHNPIIVHVAGIEMARRCARTWPEAATRLAAAFWPGPLTIVVEKTPIVPDAVTASGHTVGLRWPSHPFIQAVIRGCDFPLAAPSANPSNQLSPTNADHVRKCLGHSIPLIVDGGQSQVGIESSVVDVTTQPPRLLRPGMISAEAILAATGGIGAPSQDEAGTAPAARRSPGLLPRHYSPRARLLIRLWKDANDLMRQLADDGLNSTHCHVIAHSAIPSGESLAGVHVIPHDPEAYARALYAELHRCDDERARVIVVEAVPSTPEWSAIADRLKRASAE